LQRRRGVWPPTDHRARRQLQTQASLIAFLKRPDAPKLTSLQLHIRATGTKRASQARIFAALPPMCTVTDLSLEIRWYEVDS
jgi:hypothetical protein